MSSLARNSGGSRSARVKGASSPKSRHAKRQAAVGGRG